MTEMFAWYFPNILVLEELRCVLTARGVRFAPTLGMISMLQLLAERPDTHLMVSYPVSTSRVLFILMLYFIGSVALFGGYDTNEWPPLIYDITCTGEETSLWNCSYSLTDNGGTCGYDASAICRGK